jgi:8-oxo-dGTP pyrophosphatase MutT (NUDIX family)
MPEPLPETTTRLGMEQLRARLAAHAPRSALLDGPMSALPEAAEARARRAAVAAVLRDSLRGPELLFIRRAEHPNDPWSGHMAFPGGREELRDADLLATALRETREEIALDLAEHGKLLGRLDDLPAVARGRRTGLTIAPYVFELTRDVPLRGNYEVAEVVWWPIEPLFRGERTITYPYELAGQRVELPAFDLGGRIVWGLTHRMLEGLFALLR